MSRLVVIATGGTIATSADSEGVLRPNRKGAQLVAGLGVEVIELLAVDSSQLSPADWLRIGEAAEHADASGADGIVIAHGTDTMEETALWLELTYGGAAPVVLTGAAHNPDSVNADGPTNLHDALIVAGSKTLRDQGVLISFGGAVLDPLGTTKVNDPKFFLGGALIGTVTAETFTPHQPKQRTFLSRVDRAPRVDIASAYPGADGTAIDAFIAAGARGLVIEAMGAGNVGQSIVDAVARACARGVAVAITSRVTGTHTNASYGPGHDLVAAGAVLVPSLRTSQARVVMCAALAAGLPVGEIITRIG
jgi:L-asparaginase